MDDDELIFDDDDEVDPFYLFDEWWSPEDKEAYDQLLKPE